MVRRLLRVDTLSFRLAAGITALVVVLLALGLYALSAYHYNKIIEARQQAADLQGRLVEAALRHQMIAKDRTLVASILRGIGAQPEVKGAMILNHEGVVRVASDERLVGQRLSQDSPTCLVCHRKSPGERSRWALLPDGKGGVLRSVQPIQNGPECYQCHGAQKRVNGILILDISLEDVHEKLKRDQIWMMTATGALGFLLLVSVGWLVRRLVLARIARLGLAARSVAAGNLDERAREEGNDGIARLANDFNQMADAVSSLVHEVRSREAQLADVMNSLDDGLVVLDRGLSIVASNHAFGRRVGCLPEVVRGRHCREAVGQGYPCSQLCVACPGARCFQSGEVQRATFHLEGNGEEPSRVEEVHASPVYGKDGSVAQVVEIWRDITERVEEETRLAELERLESLGVLASGFSHEVNTPLASMLASAEGILGRLPEVGSGGADKEERLLEVEEAAATIRDEVLRCRKITEQFLRFSRGIPPSVEPVDLKPLVASMVALVSPTARQSKVKISVEDGLDVPVVRANAEVVQHVVLNLLLNAIQSFDAGGGAIAIQYRVDRDVRVLVRDQGRGIPLAAQRHLFEPFRTGRREGTGLGLFLSRRFMQRFGGDVTLLESCEGEGSCFEIVFVRAVEAA